MTWLLRPHIFRFARALLLTAVAVLLSMPGYPLDFLIFTALVPLFFVLGHSTLREGFRRGWLCGSLFFALLLHWLYTLYEWAGLFILPAHLALSALLGLSWGFFGAAFVWLERRYPQASLWTIPAIWTILEYLRALTKFGFPWGYLSDALYQRPEQLQLASLAGSWAIAFLIVLINILIYRAWRERRILWGALAAALFLLNGAWGTWQLSRPITKEQTLRVALVHSNVDQRARSDPHELPRLHALYLEQLEKLGQKLDLVVLPESFLPAYLLRQRDLLQPYQEMAHRLNISLLMGTIDYRDEKLFNTAALLDADGRVVDLYDKVQLVPFSTEYFPLINRLRDLGLAQWLGALPLGALTPGAGWIPLKSPAGTLGTPICFESIFPQIARAFAQNGAQALLIITNDAWFKGSTALEQHFAKAVFRAVETERYTLQAANGGISGMIDPRGRVHARTRDTKEAILQVEIHLQDHATLYVRLGDWFIYLLVLGLITLGLWSIKNSRSAPGVALIPVLVNLVTAPFVRFTL